uniref:Neuronal acetylcholine receptor subunit alpha-6 n=1 Tax=Magallana gigas TaxID=29159 RepID=A0A8W8LK39_MAGGI|nr:acetylcholine receptor subunit beta-type lev-1 [Crassostrea gigas]
MISLGLQCLGLLLFASVALATHLNYDISTYRTTMTSLLSNYSSKVRPIVNQGQSLQLQLSLWIAGINEVSTTDSMMTTTGYLYVRWKDELLNWDSTATGMFWMQFNQKDIWVPDIVLKNGFTDFKMMGGDFYYLYVYNDGWVDWYPYKVFETSCELDVTYYPFDSQKCDIIVKSWSYSRWEVNFTFNDPQIGFYEFVPNHVWHLESYDAETDYTNSQTDLKFTLHLKRKTKYFIANLILPIILVGVLNTFVFMIPADAGEKMGFSVTIFLTFAVFLTIVSGELPKTSDSISILSIYLIIELIISISSIMLSAVQLRIHHRKPTIEIGECFRFLVRAGRRLRCEGRKNDKSMKCFPNSCLNKPRIHEIEVIDCESRMKMNRPVEDEQEEEMDWGDVSSAIDFFAFIFLLCVQVFVTSVMFIYAAAR